MANTVAGILLTGLLSARPAASAVSAGTLYAASDTGLIYQTDGVSSWTTWATLGTSGAIVNPMTTLGDIIYGSTVVGGAATPARKGIGGSNTVLHGGFIPPAYTAVAEGDFSFTDITTANATTSQHGLSPKLNGCNTQFLNGTGTWTTPAGGGGGSTDAILGQTGIGGAQISGLQGSPDVNGFGGSGTGTDEFDTTSSGVPTGWTAFGSAAAQDTNTTALSHYYLVCAKTGSVACIGIYKASPSTPFTLVTKVTDHTPTLGNYMRGPYLFVAEASMAGKMAFVGTVHDSSAQLCVIAMTSISSFGSNLKEIDFRGQPPGAYYLKIVAHSTSNVDYYWSANGQTWLLLLAGNNPGFTIGAVGIGGDAEQTTYDTAATWDFVRFS